MDSHEVLLEKVVGMVNVPLVTVEVEALQQWTRSFELGATVHDVARYALWFALLNPVQFDDWMYVTSVYCDSEALAQCKHLRGRVAAQYRTRKLKLGGGVI